MALFVGGKKKIGSALLSVEDAPKSSRSKRETANKNQSKSNHKVHDIAQMVCISLSSVLVLFEGNTECYKD